jgi:hypothetical protein
MYMQRLAYGVPLDEERPYAISQLRPLPQSPPLLLEEDERVFQTKFSKAD